MFARQPPDDHRQRAYFDCPSSRAAPATDVTFTVISGLGVLGASVDNPDTEADERSSGTAAAFGAAAVVSAAAAVYGFAVTSSCEAAKAQLAARVRKTRSERDALLLRIRQQNRADAVACRRDTECKGERICTSGACVEPTSPSAVPDGAVPNGAVPNGAVPTNGTVPDGPLASPPAAPPAPSVPAEPVPAQPPPRSP
jgi:hypothetical protein